jgi:hypothetical protein
MLYVRDTGKLLDCLQHSIYRQSCPIQLIFMVHAVGFLSGNAGNGFYGRKTMKRAMGLVLVVLASAVVAHADRIEYDGGAVAAQDGKGFGAQVASKEAAVIVVDGTSASAREWSTTLSSLESPSRLTDDISSSEFNESAKTAEVSGGSESIRSALDGFRGTRDDGRRGRFGIEHQESVHRFLGIQDVPEPGTVLMLGMGLALITVWKRRNLMHEGECSTRP